MIKKIVLTGGPCAGKTRVLPKIREFLTGMGYRVFVVSESATELINGGITPHEDGMGLFNFQKLIILYQYQKEELFNKVLKMYQEEDVIIIYDRGIMDNKAYIPDNEFDTLLDYLSGEIGVNIDEQNILSRYDMVIHLVTSAGKRGYSLESNKARYESESIAISLDKKTMAAWEKHNNLNVVASTDNFEDKINSVLDIINNFLNEGKCVKRGNRLCRIKKQ